MLIGDRSPAERKDSFKKRNATEKTFFSTGPYATIAKSAKGIEALQEELGDLVHEQIKHELPRLLHDAAEKYEATITNLKQLGNQRSTVEEQKDALLSVSIDYHNIVKSAVEGNYTVHKDFFTDDQADPGRNHKFLCAAVQELQKQFALQMHQYGSTCTFPETVDGSGTHPPGVQDETLGYGYDAARHKQMHMTRSKGVEMIKALHSKSKGRDLPGAFISSLVSTLFHEQSQFWEDLAQEHIKNIHALCYNLVQEALQHVTSPILAKNIFEHVEVVLEKHFKKAHRELQYLIQDKNDPVAIYDPRYAAEVQKRLDHKLNNKLKAAELRANNVDPRQPSPIYNVFHEQSAANMDSDTSSAEKALDYMLALYQVRRSPGVHSEFMLTVYRAKSRLSWRTSPSKS